MRQVCGKRENTSSNLQVPSLSSSRDSLIEAFRVKCDKQATQSALGRKALAEKRLGRVKAEAASPRACDR